MGRVLIKDLTKRFGDVVAVNKLNLEIEDKEFAVLLGPSGCGKTTTLRCIAGLEDPDEGEILIKDELVNDLPPKDRNIAMVFQSYALYPHMSVFNNIAFPLKMAKFPKGEIRRRVKETAEFLKISHLLDRKPKQLSGGEAQRTALGRALIREPEVFLMDEPLSNLDAKLRVYMRAEIKKLQKDLGVTTVYVTHDQVEAMVMAEKVAIMDVGVLQQVGMPGEIYMHPNSHFVAGFIGSPPMNFLDVTWIEKNGKVFLDAGTFILLIPDTIGDIIRKNAKESELILGFRPQDVSLQKKSIPNETVKGNIYITEPLGPNTIINFKVEENIFKIETKGIFQASIGEEWWMTFDMDKIHIFDKKTHKTII